MLKGINGLSLKSSLRIFNRALVCFVLCAWVGLVLSAPLHAAVRSSANYTITEEVIANGGNTSASANYSNDSTTGQPGTIGVQISTSYQNQSGFWHAVLLAPPVPALSAIMITGLIALFSFSLLRKKMLGA